MSTMDGRYQPLMERYLDQHFTQQPFILSWMVFKGEVHFWSQLICEELNLLYPDAANMAWSFVCMAAQQNALELVEETSSQQSTLDRESPQPHIHLPLERSTFHQPSNPWANWLRQEGKPSAESNTAEAVKSSSIVTSQFEAEPNTWTRSSENHSGPPEIPDFLPSPLRQSWLDLFGDISDADVPIFTFHFIVGVDVHHGSPRHEAHLEAIQWLKSDCLNGLFGERWYLSPDLSVRQLDQSELKKLNAGHFPGTIQ